jgi:hypothetical protein
MAEVTLESEEWYVLCNWLRERENRLMYSLRPKSRSWEFVHDLRREIEHQQSKTADTKGTPQSVTLSPRQVEYLDSYLRRRARRLLVRPGRSRERRDVRHLRDHLLERVGRTE